MKYRVIAPGLPPSSVLGFGCSAVAGRIGNKQSSWALAAALDAGITHFDVARSYGYGDAEGLVGNALRGRRDSVVITTKFGITVSAQSRALRRLKPLAQRAVARFPLVRPLVRSVLRPGTRSTHRFSRDAARSSLEESLRCLGTDYIDVLFLHECTAEDISEEILDFLAAETETGRVRAYGIATAMDHVMAIAADHGNKMLYQFPNDLLTRNIDRLAGDVRHWITHSPFSGAPAVIKAMMRHPEILAPLGRVSAKPAVAHHLMLAYALSANRDGVVVCSMLSREHIANNVAVVERLPFADEQIAALADRLAAVMSSNCSCADRNER